MSVIVTQSSMTIENALFDDHPRVGVGAWGALVAMAGSWLRCNAVDLNGEQLGAYAFRLDDQGNNRCGCDEEVQCKLITSGLTPPPPLP